MKSLYEHAFEPGLAWSGWLHGSILLCHIITTDNTPRMSTVRTILDMEEYKICLVYMCIYLRLHDSFSSRMARFPSFSVLCIHISERTANARIS
jgi:hypothetical protein